MDNGKLTWTTERRKLADLKPWPRNPRQIKAECLERISDCDIFIDQMYWGENGMAACEAMAMGKSVLCYISHDKKVGVINCTADETPDQLEKYWRDKS